MEMLASGQ